MERIVIDITSDPTQLQATIDKLNQMGAVDQKNSQQFKKNNTDYNNQLSITQKAVQGVEDKMMNLGKTIVAAFAVERIYSFAKSIIDVRSEFQKFEAQLTTALGNKSAAEAAMVRIQKFAATTPFSVKELTESFVRLANRGINPTNEQFKKLGDVAAALGKPMEQVIEAILDINNTERWNELGVKVKTNGDKITGTFKGMTVEMNRTEEGAMKMIEKFGEMDTVVGGMDRQMETLTGTISNLADNWDKLLNALGEQTQGFFTDTISAISETIDWWGRYYSAVAKADKMQVSIAGSLSQWAQRTFNIGAGATEAEYLTAKIESLEEAYGKYTENVISSAKELQKEYSEKAKSAKTDAERVKIQQELSNEIDKYTKQQVQGFTRITAAMVDYDKKQLTSGDITQEIYNKSEYITRQYKDRIFQTNDKQKELIETTTKYKDLVSDTTKKVDKKTKSHKEFMDIIPPLMKKLEDLKLAYEELEVSRLKDQDKLDAQQKIEEKKVLNAYNQELASQQKLLKEKKITNKMYQDASKLALEIFEQEKINIEKKYGYLSVDLAKQLAKSKAEHGKTMANMDIEMMSLERDNEEEIYQLRIKSTEDYYNKIIGLEEDAQKRSELIKKKELDLAKIEDTEKKRIAKEIEDERNEMRRHEIAMMEITDKGEKAILKKKMDYSTEDLNRLREDFGEASDEYQKELNHFLELEAEYNKKSQKGKKEWVQNWVDSITEVLNAFLDAINNMIEAEMEANQIRMDNQREILETQRTLAAKGLDNTLAFEQKRNDELHKQQLDANEKQRKIKELQVFLNALAKFAEDDPKSALGKALALLSATKVAEAVFAEEGAIIGTHETKFRGQKHRSGRDRIAIVEEGEVIIPKAKAVEMGLNSKTKFNQFLKTPFSEKIMPIMVTQNNNYDSLTKELKELKEIVKNKQEVSINWDNFDNRIETRIKNGLKEVTKIKKTRI